MPPNGPLTPGSWSGSTSGAGPARLPTTPPRSASPGPVTDAPRAVAAKVLEGIKRKRILALMLGDTSMGMINGYFGPRLLYPIGFSEHKVDQTWLVDRVRSVDPARVESAFAFVTDRGVQFHWGEADAEDFTPDATRDQLRSYLAVLDPRGRVRGRLPGMAIPARALEPVAP